MKKFEVIKKSTDFNNIINKGKCIKNEYFRIFFVKSELNYPKFGLAVSKKCGNAVLRNKIKRQLRMLIDNNKKTFSKDNNYIIMVKKGINDISFKEMSDSFISLINRKG